MRNCWIPVFFAGIIFAFSIQFSLYGEDGPTVLSENDTEYSAKELMRRGLEKFNQGLFGQALYEFQKLSLRTTFSEYHGSALLWIAKSYITMNELDLAEENLQTFLKNFEGHPFYQEGLYQRGRLLFLKNSYQEAIAEYYDFIESFPESEFLANALFWIAESLFNLGHYRKAEKIYHQVVTQYPASYKVESAISRLQLIDLYDREEVLRNLLKVSHEEYLGSLEEFKRREKIYEQALGIYQRRLLELSELEKAEGRVSAAEPIQDDEGGGDVPAFRLKLLRMKNTVLEFKEFFIDLMEEQYRREM